MEQLTLFNKIYISFQIIYIVSIIAMGFIFFNKLRSIDRHLERQNKGKGRW